MKRKQPKPGAPMRPGRTSPANPDKTLDRTIQTKIGLELRSMYDDVVKQGVPDRFSDLLRRLDEDEGSR